MQAFIELILEELKGAWRFRWLALVSAWAVCLAGWLAVLYIPNTFEATARAFVDPTTAMTPVIQGLAVEQDVTAQLNLVRQSLLSDPQLRKVVENTSLGARAVTEADRAALVRQLRDRLHLDVQSAVALRGESLGSSRMFMLSYRDSDRDRAVTVVDTLLSSFREGTMGGKREDGARAQAMLEGLVSDYAGQLAAAEQQLADFKKKNIGMVPGGQEGDFFSRLQSEMDSVRQVQNTLAAAQTRRETLQRQLRGEAPIAAASGVPATGASAGGGDTLSRIKDTQARIDELLLRFTERHPDVIAARESLVLLEQRREQELAALRRGDANAAAMTGASSNPVYQNIQLSLNQAEVEIAGLRSQMATHQQKVAELRLFLDTQPQVEAEYQELTRNYDVTRAQYSAMADRLEKLRIGEVADATGTITFEIVDPPAADFRPVAPRRAILILGVMVGAVALGGGLAYLLNLLFPVYTSETALALATGLPVVGSVTMVKAGPEVARERMSLIAFGLGTLALLPGAVLTLVLAARFAPLGGAP